MRRERTYLYRARNHEGALLYIGISVLMKGIE